MANGRVGYIDAARGLAMLLVVYAHVNFFSLGITPFIGEILKAMRMPLFFFISGYVIYKTNYNNRSILSLLSYIWNKFKMLIIPAITMGLLYTLLILNQTVTDFAFETMKYGYWFTFSSFSMVIIYKFCEFLGRKRSEKVFMGLLIFVAMILWCLKYILINNIAFKFLNETICIWQTFTHFPFFVLGVLLSMNKDYYENHISKWGGVNTVLFIMFCCSFYYSSIELPNINFPIGGIIKLIVGASGAILMMNLILKNRDYLEHTRVGNFFQLMGRKSLAIYLLHYFLLPDMTYMANLFDTSSTIVGFSVVIFISILIMVFCIGLVSIINLSPFLSTYMLGTKIKLK